MKTSLIGSFRKKRRIINVLTFLISWSQIHAQSNLLFSNKNEKQFVSINNVSVSKNKDASPLFEENVALRKKNKNEDRKKVDAISASPESVETKELVKNVIIRPSVKLGEGNSTTKTFFSDIKQGTIGRNHEFPIDQVYDNIFNIKIDENVANYGSALLEYELYGISDYKGISKYINDEFANSTTSLSLNKAWTLQSEYINVQNLYAGNNTITFTIPENADYSYRVKNVRIKLSKNQSNKFSVENPYKGEVMFKSFLVGRSQEIGLNVAKLSVDDKSLKENKKISISALREIDLPATAPEMVNVTKQNAGYRFLPHGEHFSIPAKISIGYDKSKIPEGYTEQDVKTFYFDRYQKKWIALEKDSLNLKDQFVVSNSTHFTDMINGVIKVPESPETGSYAPNSIKDIKAADPSAGIVGISTPSPNNLGTVTTNFPIKLPAGRAGIQPSLSVNYNSEGGNGWMGLGWDLSIPSISIDTRWGVPVYGDTNGDGNSDNIETEIYTIGGEQLTFKVGNSYVMPNRNEGFNQTRISDREFYPRIEGGYSKIVRKGTNPTNYVWVVTAKDGTRSCFGGDENGNVNENAVLRQTGTNNIGYWSLYKTIDTNGNYTSYNYQKFSYNSSGTLGNGGQEMYISSIEYTKNDANPNLKKYTVNFKLEEVGPPRNDVEVNARLGFVQVTSKRLSNISINYDGAPVRSYVFTYDYGAFSKSLLTSITEKDAAGQDFYTNRIEYNQAPDSNNLFSSPKTWSISGSTLEAQSFSGINQSFGNAESEKFGGNYTTINSSSSESKNNSFRIGFWAYSALSTDVGSLYKKIFGEVKRLSIGASGGFGNNKSINKISLIDIDGDNLPDVVYKNGNTVSYAKNTLNGFTFGNNLGISSLGLSESSSWNVGFDGNLSATDAISVGIGFDYSNTTSKNKIFFNDFNGDGLIDLSSNGKVFFNYRNLLNGQHIFSEESSPTPAPIKIIQNNSVNSFTFGSNEKDEKRLLLEQNPLHDVVRVWTAPKSGNITVTGNYNLVQQQFPNPNYDSNQPISITNPQYLDYPFGEDITYVDGVAVSVQKGSNDPSFVDNINKGDYNIKNLPTQSYNVQKGEKIYFRVTSKYDGRFDRVKWDPIITYISNTDPAIDGDSKSLNIYKASEDYVISNNSEFTAPENGNLSIYLDKLVTSDTSKVSIIKNGVSMQDIIVSSPSYTNLLLTTIPLIKDDKVSIKLSSDTNIRWAEVKLTPKFIGNSGAISYAQNETEMYNREHGTMSTYIIPASLQNQTIALKLPASFTFSQSITNGKIVLSAKENNRLLAKTVYKVINHNISLDGILQSYTVQPSDIGKTIHLELFYNTPVNQYTESQYQNIVNELLSVNNEISVYSNNFINNPNQNSVQVNNGTISVTGTVYVNQSPAVLNLSFIAQQPGNATTYATLNINGQNYTVNSSNQFYNNIVVPATTAYTLTFYPNGFFYGSYAELKVNNFGTLISQFSNTLKTQVFDYNLQNSLPANTSDSRLGNLYRGWGGFILNGNNKAKTNIANSNDPNSNFYNGGTVSEMKVNEQELRMPSSSMSYNQNTTINNPTVDNNGNVTLPQNNASANNMYFVMMSSVLDDKANRRWVGLDEENYISGELINSSRLGVDDIEQNFQASVPSFQLGSDKMASIEQRSKIKSISTKTNVNFSTSWISGDGGISNTIFVENKSLSALADYNGDQFPDFIIEQNVQFTNPNGFLSANKQSVGYHSISRSSAIGVGAGTSFVHGSGSYAMVISKSGVGGKLKQIDFVSDGKSSSFKPQVSLNGNLSYEDEYSKTAYVDINGDGLPDQVTDKNVKLGLGYKFEPNSNFSVPLDISNSKNQTYGLGLGVSILAGSFQGGGNFGGTTNFNNQQLIDLNGDGLLDFIDYESNNYKINLGNRFLDSPYFNVSPFDEKNASVSTGVSFGFSVPIGIPIAITPTGQVVNGFKIVPSYSRSMNDGVSRTKSTFRDMNGDGYPDYITSEDTSGITVRLNQLGERYDSNGNVTATIPTNLLKKVTLPMGGSWEVTYERKGNTYDMPQSKYVMKTVTVNDGFTGDDSFDPLISKVSIDYTDGYHSRRERAFYGFGKVRITQIDTKNNNLPYRYTEQIYKNTNYYQKGLLLSETLFNASGTKWTEKLNEYSLREVHNTVATASVLEKENEKTAANYAYFVPLVKVTSNFYEGQGSIGKSTNTQFTSFSQWGDPTTIIDSGDIEIGGTEVLSSTVTYGDVAPGKYVIAPKKIVSTATNVIRTRDAGYNPSTGDLTTITMTGGGNPVYEFEYDIYGNIKKSTGPANINGQRFFHEYTYDTNVATYPILVKDAFGYTSKTQYDFRFGLPTLTEDMNLQPVRFEYDEKGRNVTVTGPYEMFNSIPWTILFEYSPITNAPTSGSNTLTTAQSYAITKHFDQGGRSGFNTITVSDGLGMAIQVKKTGELHNEDLKYIVAGKVEQDAFGRALKIFYPTVESIDSSNVLYNAGVDTVPPTFNTYDVLDRVTSTKLPGENLFSTVSYGFGNDRLNRKMFETTFTDELGTVKKTYTDIKGRTTTVKEPSNTGDIITSFTHDVLGNILQVKDVENNLTNSVYDDLGRRISYQHPDSGLTTFVYDAASNLINRTNSENQTINYRYDYTRLKEVNYPNYPENNVRYYYGNAMDAAAMDNNSVGRLWYQTDATGTQYFKYGRLGEITHQRRSVAVPGGQVFWFGTDWEYDTWNRVKSITYSDGEIVRYGYNKAGNLTEMISIRDGYKSHILQNIGYDKFEQRVFLKYGNGSTTTYEYETNRRRLLKMNAQTGNNARFFMQNVYQYDVVSNVMQIHNNAPFAPSGLLGGGTNYAYGYDDLYRLTTASGNWRGMNALGQEERQRYTVTMAYDNMHNVTSKVQKHERALGATGNTWLNMEPTSYRLTYSGYGGTQPHAPKRIIDEPNIPGALCCNNTNPQVKFQRYNYDKKGNPLAIEQQTCNFAEPKALYRWDEENRLRFVDTNPSTPAQDGAAIYTYDAGGERIIKQGLGAGFYTDSNGANVEKQSLLYKIYPSGLLSADIYKDPENKWKLKYTKHYYAGSQRVMSRISNGRDVGVFNCNWLIIPYSTAGVPINPVTVSNQILQTATQSSLAVMAAYGITPPPGYGQNAGYNGSCVNSYPSSDPEAERKFSYWFHSDHLGSSSYITGIDGEVTQNIEYFPSGEVFVENHKNSFNTPYKFNAKELDSETGYYYYGARYYNPRTSIWLSVDPLAVYNPIMETEFYGDGEHNDGVYNSGNLNPYIYCYQNPIKYIDPNGKQVISPFLGPALMSNVGTLVRVAPLEPVRIGLPRVGVPRLGGIQELKPALERPIIQLESTRKNTTFKNRYENDLEKAEDKLDGIQRNQNNQKKNAPRGDKQNRIESIKKSEQNFKYQLKRLKLDDLKKDNDNIQVTPGMVNPPGSEEKQKQKQSVPKYYIEA